MSGVTALTFYPSAVDETYKAGDISFTYDGSSLTNAEDQKDLLFTSRKIEAGEKEAFMKPNGVQVLFHHALTAVKFQMLAENVEDDKIQITKIEFSGLKDKGNCVISPIKENGGFNFDEATGKYSVNLEKMQEAVKSFVTKVIVLQGDGNKVEVDKWIKEKSVVTEDLQKSLDKIAGAGIPKDIVYRQGAEVLGL